MTSRAQSVLSFLSRNSINDSSEATTAQGIKEPETPAHPTTSAGQPTQGVKIELHDVEPESSGPQGTRSTVFDFIRDPRDPFASIEFLSSSFGEHSGATPASHPHNHPVHPAPNGLIQAVLFAYNNHCHLSIRPDDVWICILTQLSFYINAHAEAMRHQFVAHEGKVALVAGDPALITQINEQIKEHLVDDRVHAWLIPDFSATTPTDVVAAGVSVMAIMAQYFDYIFLTRCGIPSITLEGTRDDWVSLRDRIRFFRTLGRDELARWHDMLIPIVDRFVVAFDGPAQVTADTPGFWCKIVSCSSRGSGKQYIDGWIGVFCAFSKEGVWQLGNQAWMAGLASGLGMKLSVICPKLHMKKIPPAKVEVNVTVIEAGVEYDGRLVAGLLGKQWNAEKMAIVPCVGWVMYTKGLKKITIGD